MFYFDYSLRLTFICPLFMPIESTGLQTLDFYWNLSQWWQKFDNLPTRASHVSLHRTANDKWFIMQYYTSETLLFSHEPFAFWFENPVTLRTGFDVFPIIGLSFNHIVWIEKAKSGSGNRDKNVLRLASFPEPWDDSLKRHESIRDLDVPSDILDVTHQIFIEPALGSVIIISRFNEIHRIPFA